MTALENLGALERRNPEWSPWLAVIGTVLESLEDDAWRDRVPAAHPQAGVPWLAGAAVRPAPAALLRLLEKLLHAAALNASEAMARVAAMRPSQALACTLFEAAVNGDAERLAAQAKAGSADPSAFGAISALLPLPFLHACREGWGASATRGWTKTYCPVCGAWPAFAEVRGIERNRHLRCARCGSAWEAAPLSCLRCGTSDHHALGSLVPEVPGAQSSIEVCRTCKAYVKVFTALQGCAPAQVIVDDLASVELDLAAAGRGYDRPSGCACVLDVTLRGCGA